MNWLSRVSQLPERHLGKERLVFLRQWIRHPLRMGAIAPSSRGLSQLICQEAAYHPDQYVIELGAGTGRLTEQLLETGIPLQKLIVIEMDPLLCAFLREKFPGLEVICGDACHLDTLLPPSLHGKVSSVVSGLPLKVISHKKVQEIVRSSFQVLSPEGHFLQFTYSLTPPFSGAPLGLSQERVGQIFLNLPPASVWRFFR